MEGGCQGLNVKIGDRPPSALEGRHRGKSKGLGGGGFPPRVRQDCCSSPVYTVVRGMVLCFLESRDSLCFRRISLASKESGGSLETRT